MKKWAKNNPMRYTFNNLKQNAKRRGKEFSLTFDQFKEFAIETDYMLGKGRTRTSLHIDRDREEEGYHIDNIKVLENHKNVKKYQKSLHYDFDHKGKPENFTFEPLDSNPDQSDDCPF